MKNKRLMIILLSVFAIIIAVLLFTSTFFCVKKASIDLKTENIITQSQKVEICSNEYIEFNKSIFFYNKNELKDKLEKAYPNLKVTDIESVFPNKIVIHAEERQELFYIQSNNNYYSIDSTGKILGKYYDEPNLIYLQNFNVNTENMNVGEFLSSKSVSLLINNIYISLYSSSLDTIDMISRIKRIEYTDDYLIFKTLFSGDIGVDLKIENCDYNLTEKTIYVLSAYNSLTNDEKSHGTILLQENLEDSTKYIISYIS